MTKIAYVNGKFMPETDANISIFDRGFLFGDGIYEAVSVVDGKLIDVAPHLMRLERSLAAIDLNTPHSNEEIIKMLRELALRNQFKEGLLYFQITRGAAPRAFDFPANNTSSIVAFTLPMALIDREDVRTGVKVISVPEQRWARRDIKSIGLLPQCLAKQAATEQGAYEAIMVEQDALGSSIITEGSSSTAYIVKDNVLITRPLSQAVLPGITRQAVMALSEKDGIGVEERIFSLDEMIQADEACLTAASNFVMPVVEIDGKKIGDGKPGPIVKQLRARYIEIALASAI